MREQKVKDLEGREYSLLVRPYRTIGNKIDAAIITLVELRGRSRRMQVKPPNRAKSLLALIRSGAERMTVKSRHRLGEPCANQSVQI